MSDFSKFCEMLVNKVYNDEKIVSEEGIKLMTKKYSNGFHPTQKWNLWMVWILIHGMKVELYRA